MSLYTSTTGVTRSAPIMYASVDGVLRVIAQNSIIKVLDSFPVQSSALTYSGSEQSPTWSNYDSEQLEIGGTTSATNAGTYIATFTPKSGYCWPDETTEAKSVTWTIAKAAGSMTLSQTSVSLTSSSKTSTITVTRTGYGAVSAVSSNTAVATVSLTAGSEPSMDGLIDYNRVKITAVSSGTATITISVGEGTNYTAPASKTVLVTVQLVSSTLADNTPETIQQVAKSGQAANYWSVGDKIPIALSGTVGALTLNGTYYAFIIGFNHNSSIEGNNSIHFQFGKTSNGTDIAFVDGGYDNTGSTAGFRMNTSATNSGGWKSSYMRQTICPAFLSALPTAWRNVIAACTKYSDNTGGGDGSYLSYVSSTFDSIFLLSEKEVFGTVYNSNEYEGNFNTQYDYYKNGNSVTKYKHSNAGVVCGWWLRSVRASRSTSFQRVGETSSASSTANSSIGFAPGFMVA